MSKFALGMVMGLEIEYMIVDKKTLKVRPISDQILKYFSGSWANQVSFGDIAISNELVLHVLEFKNLLPQPQNFNFTHAFQTQINALEAVLDEYGAMLLPSASHPFMDPLIETQRWPHGQDEIYSAYDEIFSCKGHGWSNLQSIHINLPFKDDNEFFKLHNTLRIMLPLLPALCASSPYIEGHATGILDNRLVFYGQNQSIIPEIAGFVIPEFIPSIEKYHENIMEPMYQAIMPFDPKGVLKAPWLNSRGVIPKFDVGALEIRIIDSQECVKADVAIADLVNALSQYWLENGDYHLKQIASLNDLVKVYQNTIKQGFSTVIDNAELMRHWQVQPQKMNVRQLWSILIERVASKLSYETQRVLEFILNQGSLSERLLLRGGAAPCPQALIALYKHLADCLKHNKLLGEA